MTERSDAPPSRTERIQQFFVEFQDEAQALVHHKLLNKDEAGAIASAFARIAADVEARRSETGQADALAAIREHNEGCEASCKAQRATDSSTGCGYQNKDGTLIYARRNCPACPLDWKIEFPLPPAAR